MTLAETREMALRHALEFHKNDYGVSGDQILETAERFLHFLHTGKAEMVPEDGSTPTT
jgi:hypothetical protein